MVRRSPARLSRRARGFRLAAVPMSKLRTMADALPLTLAVFWLRSRWS
jgi:hypothetical protein